MFYTTLYFVFCYGVVWCVIVPLRIALERDKIRPAIGIAITGLLLMAPLFPYARVAVQTTLYRKAMLAEVRKALASMGENSDDIVTLRVLSISHSLSRVYVVQPCGTQKNKGQLRSATIFFFKRTAKGWQFDTYDTPWSDCGSATGNTFPPYLDANEF